MIYRQGEFDLMQPILERAFPGSTFHFMENSFFMKVLGVNRPMGPKELSDGTLKFLALAAACFAKRPEPLVAFNEPENSLSPAAIEPLADMFAHAAQYSQLWVTTHSEELAQAMVNRTACRPIHLEKLDGETTLKGRSMKHGYQSEE